MKTREIKDIYQFKITMKDISPSIWRRIVVPGSYTFWDLHVAIQDVMGWTTSHLHSFRRTINRNNYVTIETPSEEFVDDFGPEPLPERKEKIANWFSKELKTFIYTYDFGDDWEHEIKLEKILPANEKIKYPLCLSGERACPPEDCGGAYGYDELLEIVKNPKHKEHKETMEWLGGEFDPELFDCNNVHFTNPEKMWKLYQ